MSLTHKAGTVTETMILKVTIGSTDPIKNRNKIAEAVLKGLIDQSFGEGIVAFDDANEGCTSLIAVELENEK